MEFMPPDQSRYGAIPINTEITEFKMQHAQSAEVYTIPECPHCAAIREVQERINNAEKNGEQIQITGPWEQSKPNLEKLTKDQ